MGTVLRDHHWETLSRSWTHIGSPLRPCAQDVEHYRELIGLPRRDALRVLIFGVTPEFLSLPWSDESEVWAVDRSEELIQVIWPGPMNRAVCANWLDLPFDNGFFDCVLCDGGMHLLNYPDQQSRLSGILARFLKPGGRFAIRLFVLPEVPEGPSSVLGDLSDGKVPDIHCLKLRLGMALQTSAQAGLVVDEVYQSVVGAYGSMDALQKATGWPREEVLTLTSYRQSSNRYHFLTEEQSIELLGADRRMIFERRVAGSYPLGDRCPLVLMRRV